MVLSIAEVLESSQQAESQQVDGGVAEHICGSIADCDRVTGPNLQSVRIVGQPIDVVTSSLIAACQNQLRRANAAAAEYTAARLSNGLNRIEWCAGWNFVASIVQQAAGIVETGFGQWSFDDIAI